MHRTGFIVRPNGADHQRRYLRCKAAWMLNGGMNLPTRQWKRGEEFSLSAPTPRWTRPSLGLQPCLRGRHSGAAAFGCALARYADGVSQWRDLLAPVAALARTGHLGESLATTVAPVRRARTNRLGRGLCRRHVSASQEGGEAVGKTMRGKGMKLTLAVERHGTPLGVYVCSAKPSEHQVGEPV
jgi:hypothetical protein